VKVLISTCRNSNTKKVVPLKITEENFIDEMKKGNEKALEYVIDNYAWIIKTVLKKHLFYLEDFLIIKSTVFEGESKIKYSQFY
jgi:hypothetical protein